MSDRPNFLLIMSDQHHPRVMGCAGDPLVRTPNLDALARAGTRFSSAYCASPLCVPSRMAFMTSQRCSDTDVYTNSCYLASDVPTFAHSLGAAGYEVTLGGRMHFMGPDQRHGFHRRVMSDVSGGLGHIPAVSCAQVRETVEVYGPGRTSYQAYDYAVLEGCQGYIRELAERPDDPFCLVAGFVLPHCPYIAPRPLYDYYYERVELPARPEECLQSMPEPVRSMCCRRGFDRVTPEAMRGALAAYYGLVELFDGIVGSLTESLRQAGLTDNTVIIYTSDHGDSIGENGWWCKTTFYEGSVGVPMIISGPSLPQGACCGRNASLMDLGPTMIDYAGGPALPHAAGRSLRRLIEQREPPLWDDTVIAEMIGYRDDPPGHMIKQGPWKLVHYEGHEPLLYNIEEDPRELVNRAGDPEVAYLRDQLTRRLVDTWDPWRAQKVLAERERDRGVLNAWRRQNAAPDLDHWQAPPGVNVWPEE